MAERIVVTADSISMIAEASATGKPVEMFDFGSGSAPMRTDAVVDAEQSLLTRARGLLYEAYMRLPRGRLNRSRDLRIVHRALLATGRITWLGEAMPAPTMRFVGDEMTRTLNRLRGLLTVPPRPAVADGLTPRAELAVANA